MEEAELSRTEREANTECGGRIDRDEESRDAGR